MIPLLKTLTGLLYPAALVTELCVLTLVARRRYPRLATSATAAALFLLMLCGTPWFPFFLQHRLEAIVAPPAAIPHADAIVILGAWAESPHPPQPAYAADSAGANRLLYGAALYHRGYAPIVIVSGAATAPGLPTVAQSMTAILTELGVPPAAILQDSGATNTYQNALGVRALIQMHRLQSLLLVTSAFHMPRALAIFRGLAMQATPAPCDYNASQADYATVSGSWRRIIPNLIPSAQYLSETGRVFKEFVALVFHLTGAA